MARKKFLRSKWRTYSKLGKGRKKLQKYRKAKGRHNKVREKKTGNPILAAIGFKKKEKPAIPRIENLKDLENIKSGTKAIIANIGKKKKMIILRAAEEKKIILINVNKNKFAKKVKRMLEENKKRRAEKEDKKKKEEKKKAKQKEEKTETAVKSAEEKNETG